MARVDRSKAPCLLCVSGGSLERLANRATHMASLGDGKLFLACAMHAEMCGRGAGFSWPIPEGFTWAEKTDQEVRDALRVATYDERDDRRQAERDARTVTVKIQIEDATGNRPLPSG